MEQNKPQTEQDISQQAAVRRQKLADLRAGRVFQSWSSRL